MSYEPNSPSIQMPPTVNPAPSPQPPRRVSPRPVLHATLTPQDYADALLRLTSNASNQIRTPGALGTNLMADALLRFEQARAQAKLSAPSSGQAPANPPPSVQNPDGSVSGPYPGSGQ